MNSEDDQRQHAARDEDALPSDAGISFDDAMPPMDRHRAKPQKHQATRLGRSRFGTNSSTAR